ncbi:MAG: hypothetical protein E6G91_06785 [Alphaproteobacteria bacterium]|nr:MAG: hypothetical protein E6G91_06785 [Alphaproteobacteria bacterium]
MSFWFRIVPVAATLAVSVVSGTYYTVRLAHECAGVGFVSCIKDTLFPVTSAPQKVLTEPPKKVPKSVPKATIEAMLISTGHLDGEVGRVDKSDFDKAVKAFQASLGRDREGGELTVSQRKTLQGRFEATRTAWQLRKVSDPQGFELSLPAILLSESRRLKYGRRYGSESGDFSVDVAQFATSDWTLEKLEEQHCCRISTSRKLEHKTVVHADGDVRGFILSALDGNDRISVRAFQKDNVIRLLAITYKVERDKEFRSLRNTIASSYVPFGSTAPEDRVASCASEEPDRASCNEKPDRNVWKRIVHDP